jgi:hypothetical protein
VVLNERVRAPLCDLVFHDSVVSTWRWNFTPDRYSDPKWWTKHDLIEMIGGDIPIFMVNRRHLDANGERVVQSYKDVSEWNARVGLDELVDHRALTPDRPAQESRFSSGWDHREFFRDCPLLIGAGSHPAVVVPDLPLAVRRQTGGASGAGDKAQTPHHRTKQSRYY